MTLNTTPQCCNDPDTQLMLSVKEGDHDAFAQLDARYRNKIYRCITRLMGHERSAEDLTQEVLRRVFRSRKKYEPTAQFNTWLYTITHNVVRNEYRRLSHRIKVSHTDFSKGNRGIVFRNTYKGHDDPVHIAKRKELERFSRDVIARIGTNQRRAIELVYLKHHTYEEGAKIMRISLNAFESLVQRGRTSIRNAAQHEIEHYL